MTTAEIRLQELGLTLPDSCTPRGNFLPFTVERGMVLMAGQICEWNGSVPWTGPVAGSDAVVCPGLDLESAQSAARSCALNLLFHLRAACDGDLGRVRKVLRVGGFVNGLPGFDRSPAVVNGASDLFTELWGEAGRHARTAVGVSGLPANASVEVDAVFLID